jgi:hypothetical protein
MKTHLTPTERLILMALRLQPGISAERLVELTGAGKGKHVRASLRTMVLAGIVTEEARVVGKLYKVTEVSNGL